MVLSLATAEDLVFHELLRWSGLPDRGSLRHAIEGLRGAHQLRCIVRTVLAIADELKAELAEIEAGRSEEDIADLQRGWSAPEGRMPIIQSGKVVICQHGQCPHISACIGAGACTEPAMLMPAYLPLRKADDGAA